MVGIHAHDAAQQVDVIGRELHLLGVQDDLLVLAGFDEALDDLHVEMLNDYSKDLGKIQIKICEIQIKADFSLDFDQNYFENSRICEIQIKILFFTLNLIFLYEIKFFFPFNNDLMERGNKKSVF